MGRGSGGEPPAQSRPAAPPGRGGLTRGSEEAARPRRARGALAPPVQAELQRGVRGAGPGASPFPRSASGGN